MTVGRLDPFRVDVDTGIVNDGIQQSEQVDLVGDAHHVGSYRQVADDEVSATRDEIIDVACSFGVPGVHDDAVPVVEERSRRGLAESGRRAGDEHA